MVEEHHNSKDIPFYHLQFEKHTYFKYKVSQLRPLNYYKSHADLLQIYLFRKQRKLQNLYFKTKFYMFQYKEHNFRFYQIFK